MSRDIVEFQPLIEAVDFQGNKYYTASTMEKFTETKKENEDIYFSLSNRACRSSQIINYGPANEEDIMIEWLKQPLSGRERNILDSGIKEWQSYYPFKTPNQALVTGMIEKIKDGLSPFTGQTH